MKKLTLPKIKINPQKICKTGVVVSFVCLVASIFMQILVSNTYAVKGSEFLSLKDQKEQLERENSLLKLAISEESSLAVVEGKALELGFVEYDSAIAVITSPQFAVAR